MHERINRENQYTEVRWDKNEELWQRFGHSYHFALFPYTMIIAFRLLFEFVLLFLISVKYSFRI